MRTVLYPRVSGAAQATDDETSLPEQERLCRERCKREGWTVGEVSQDASISGETIEERPAMRRLLIDAAAGKFDVVVAYHQDRIASSTEAFGEALEKALQWGSA